MPARYAAHVSVVYEGRGCRRQNKKVLHFTASHCIFNVDTVLTGSNKQGDNMQTKIQKWGNSLALRIPKAFALNINIRQNELVDLSIGDGRLIITPITEKKYSLKELLAGVSKDNLHEEFDTGSPVGKELL